MTTPIRARTPADLLVDPADCDLVAERMVEAACREHPEAILVAAYEDERGQSETLRAAIVAAADEAGLPVFHQLVSCDGRWFEPGRVGTSHDDAGQPLPPPDAVPAVADLVGRGVSPLPDRESFVSTALPTVDQVRARGVAQVIASRGAQAPSTWPSPRAVDRVWRCVLDPSPEASPVADLPDPALAVALVSLHDVGWRDALLGALGPGTIPESALDDAMVRRAREVTVACPWVVREEPGDEDERAAVVVLGRLADLFVLAPEDVSAPLLVTMAHLAWWDGDGTVAGACLERALAIDPEHRLAGLMHQLLQLGVRLRGRLEEPDVA